MIRYLQYFATAVSISTTTPFYSWYYCFCAKGTVRSWDVSCSYTCFPVLGDTQSLWSAEPHEHMDLPPLQHAARSTGVARFEKARYRTFFTLPRSVIVSCLQAVRKRIRVWKQGADGVPWYRSRIYAIESRSTHRSLRNNCGFDVELYLTNHAFGAGCVLLLRVVEYVIIIPVDSCCARLASSLTRAYFLTLTLCVPRLPRHYNQSVRYLRPSITD